MSYQQIAETEHTPDHISCPVCAKAQLVLFASLTPDLTFKAYFDLWIAQRTIETGGAFSNASYLSLKTIKDYKTSALALGKFFNNLPIEQIHVGHIMMYQQARAMCDKKVGDWSKPAGANLIRKEITLLTCILADAGLWKKRHRKGFEKLRRVEPNISGALSPEQQHTLLHVAASSERWQYIYWYCIVALQTTASTDEMRGLRIGDVLLRDGVIQIRSGKNKYRLRTIPLVTPDVAWALERLLARAKEMGSRLPSHYLFPFCVKSNGFGAQYDPNRPMSDSGLKKPWDEVRRAAGLPRMRIYDLRHTGITRMAEAGTPIAVIMAFAGHMTLRMQQHYTTISMSARKGWAQATWQGMVPDAARAAFPPSQPTPVANSRQDWQETAKAGNTQQNKTA